MKPFKFLNTVDQHEFHFELHGNAMLLTYTMSSDMFDIHEEMSVSSMIQDVIDTWRFYRNNIDQRVINIIEETLADHLRGHSKVTFVN
jgi:hypothetical protein